jgi:hypothetical protein
MFIGFGGLIGRDTEHRIIHIDPIYPGTPYLRGSKTRIQSTPDQGRRFEPVCTLEVALLT